MILCKTAKHKSNSRDFKSPAFSWKKQPGFFLKFLGVQTVARTSGRICKDVAIYAFPGGKKNPNQNKEALSKC